MDLRSLIRDILKEEYGTEGVFDPANPVYLDAWLDVGDEDMDTYHEYGVTETIPRIIEEVRNLKFPLRIYRGIRYFGDLKDVNIVGDDEHYNTSWTTDIKVAREFGNVVYTGMVESPEDINLEYTVYRRILHKPLDESEIVMKDNKLIKNIKNI